MNMADIADHLLIEIRDRVGTLTLNRPEKLNREALTHIRCGQTEDHREGVAAFLEKREPRFRGR